ncbi:MAG: hypothetical protein ACOCP3_02515 [Halodesulfurarchaeum sp.]
MTENDHTTESPFGAVFEMQRELIDRSLEVAEESVSAPAEVGSAMQSRADEHVDVHQRAITVGRQQIEAILDAMEAAIPSEEASLENLRESVDEGFDDLLAAHDEAVESREQAVKAGIDEYETAVEDVLEFLDTQLDLLNRANEDFGSRTVDALEALLGQYENLQADIQSRSEDLSAELRDQLAAFDGRLEDEIDQYRKTLTNLESQFEEVRSEAEWGTVEGSSEDSTQE